MSDNTIRIEDISVAQSVDGVVSLPALRADGELVKVPLGMIGGGGGSAGILVVDNSSDAEQALSYTIEPGCYYRLGTATTLEVNLAGGTGGTLAEYMFSFVCQGTTLTLPDSVKVAGEPVFTDGWKYIVRITDNIATIGGAEL